MTAKEYAKKHSELEKLVTMGLLLEFTDEFLIPRFSDLMDIKLKEANGQLEYNLKTYIDNKMADYTSGIFKCLERKAIKER